MNPPKYRLLKVLLVLFSVAVFCATLTAGLWPFNFDMRNHVSWIPNQAGLHFGEHAMVASAQPFEQTNLCINNAVSLELWVEPEATFASGTILAVSLTQEPESFAVRQDFRDVALSRNFWIRKGKTAKRLLNLQNVYTKGKRIFLTLTADGEEFRAYVDGREQLDTHDFGLHCEDLSGALILGNSLVRNDSWRGSVLGLALYNRLLSASDVEQHFELWTRGRNSVLPQSLNAMSLYLFNERAGGVVHNLGSKGPNLNAQEDYLIHHKKFLQPFWEEFRLSRSFALDVVINVVGFMPLGFCVAALLSWWFPSKHSLTRAAALCFLVSLTIEVLQGFMPTRNSGTTDLITNTSGGALGAWLYLTLASGSALEKLRFIRR